jgi:hypothetical protein
LFPDNSGQVAGRRDGARQSRRPIPRQTKAAGSVEPWSKGAARTPKVSDAVEKRISKLLRAVVSIVQTARSCRVGQSTVQRVTAAL